MIADQTEAITIEPTEQGLMLYDNPLGVLTNNPPFPYHMVNICNYMNITSDEAKNRICKEVYLEPYSRGLGSYGLPGDWTSASRFVRAAFVKWNSPKIGTETESVAQFFTFSIPLRR